MLSFISGFIFLRGSHLVLSMCFFIKKLNKQPESVSDSLHKFSLPRNKSTKEV
ncbi:hypothetical protein SAMN04489761_3105 [Tenacibaculum sp. MAR_2009_124]|nr:hypothetical protein SAMN04489761_3105 [Tenacibaculum sp. MAR_2009_124]